MTDQEFAFYEAYLRLLTENDDLRAELLVAQQLLERIAADPLVGCTTIFGPLAVKRLSEWEELWQQHAAPLVAGVRGDERTRPWDRIVFLDRHRLLREHSQDIGAQGNETRFLT